MDLRSSRSRSKTPFLSTEGTQEVTFEHQTILEETSVKHSYSTRSRNVKSSSGSDEVFASPDKQITSSSARMLKKSNSGSKSSARHKTSDYSSEEGENEITSSKNVENESSRSITNRNNAHGNKSTNGNAGLIAFKVYKEAGEYWNKFPKTDYTYSKHSRDRFEVAPGVVGMPNMSRRSLHRYGDSTLNYSSQTQQEEEEDYDYYVETAAKYNEYQPNKSHHHSAKLEPKRLFDDEIEYSYTRKITRSIYRFFMRMYITVLSVFTVINHTVSTVLLNVGKSYYRFVSRMLLFDNWLLLKNTDHRRFIGALLAIFMLPLLLLFGMQVAQARGYDFTPTCYPNCGKIANEYVYSAFDSVQHAIYRN